MPSPPSNYNPAYHALTIARAFGNFFGFDSDSGFMNSLIPFDSALDPWEGLISPSRTGRPTNPAVDQGALTLGTATTPQEVASIGPGTAHLQAQEPDLVPKTGAEIKGWFTKYKNGRIPQNALTQVSAGASTGYMRPDAAAAFTAMIRAARADGVTASFTDSYRSYQAQVDCVRRKGLYSQGGLCATPGTSEHGWGLAIDFNLGANPKLLTWLRRNADDYGFKNIPREAWHWQYEGGYDGPSADTEPTKGKVRRNGQVYNNVQELAPYVALTGDPVVSRASAFALGLADLVTGQESMRSRRKDEPDFGSSNKAQIQRQLYRGFMDAGRPDLARMVKTKAFQTWVAAESGWRPDIVSKAYTIGSVTGVNGGLFQFRYPAHPWAQDYFSKGNTPNGQFTMSPYEQAMAVVAHFGALTPAKIREYAQQIANGTYHGWP